MIIYEAEQLDNIAENIQANTSIAYITNIEKANNLVKYNKLELPWSELPWIDQDNYELSDAITASIKDSELYYHTSILVTTNWNKNDDVFMPPVVWAAKDTPVHKPTNLGHDSTKIIGHMTASWAINEEGKTIEATEDVVELPSKFHILVGSVIYKVWPSSEEYEKNIEDLIKEIEAGEKYVSMECTFKNFDYALKDENSKQLKIVARNKDTAFLSKYLRAYGGEGYYNNYKIGRVVREISFCGKGYVDKPANPESVIFTKDEISDFSQAKIVENFKEIEKCGVISNNNEILAMETKLMSDFYKEQNDELKATNTALAKSIDELKEKLAQSNINDLEKKIESLTAQTNDMSDALKQKSDVVTAKETEVTALNTKVADLTKANEELTNVNKSLTEKLATIEAEAKTTARVSTLVAGGFTKEEADEKVKIFAALDDTQFNVIATELVAAKTAKANKPAETENPTEATAEDLEETEVTSPEVTSASIVDEGDFNISELAGKLSAEFRTKDGDK